VVVPKLLAPLRIPPAHADHAAPILRDQFARHRHRLPGRISVATVGGAQHGLHEE
jgi:hypothetical protein